MQILRPTVGVGLHDVCDTGEFDQVLLDEVALYRIKNLMGRGMGQV